MIHSTLFPDPVYAASVFTIKADSVLQYVSAMTGDLDTAVTASVHLLNEDAATPADGTLPGSYAETFRYAGYHRLALDGGLQLPAGARIAVAVLETVPTDGGVKYALVNTSSLNRKGAEEHNAAAGRYDSSVSRYATGIINPGESFVSFEPGKWTDWSDAEKPALRVLIIPKFEIDEMSGDYPGEAQPFYERYFAGCKETGIPNALPTAHFYFNPESSAGLLVTGASKTSAALSIMALLASGNYDLSDTYIVSVGCAGGSIGKSTLGDVILVTSACDYDLGHHVDTHEHSRNDSRVTWFPDVPLRKPDTGS